MIFCGLIGLLFKKLIIVLPGSKSVQRNDGSKMSFWKTLSSQRSFHLDPIKFDQNKVSPKLVIKQLQKDTIVEIFLRCLGSNVTITAFDSDLRGIICL